MKIIDIKTFLMMAGAPESTGSSSWSARNWCFVKIYTDEGIVGIGEATLAPRWRIEVYFCSTARNHKSDRSKLSERTESNQQDADH